MVLINLSSLMFRMPVSTRNSTSGRRNLSAALSGAAPRPSTQARQVSRSVDAVEQDPEDVDTNGTGNVEDGVAHRPAAGNQPDATANAEMESLVAKAAAPMYSLASISNEILNSLSLFGSPEKAAIFQSLCSTTGVYAKRKDDILKRLFYVLSLNEHLKHLAEQVPEPEIENEKEYRFFIELRGPKTPAKKKVLNTCLILFSQCLIRKEWVGKDLSKKEDFAAAQYQPNHVLTLFKMLFAEFSERCIVYRLQRDFKGKGKLLAYWRYVFEITKSSRPDYGTTPHAAQFDANWRIKRQRAIESGELKPLTDYKHHLMVLTEELMCCNNLRGSKEVS